MKKVCPQCGSFLVYRHGISKKTGEPYEMMSCPNYNSKDQTGCKYAENAPSTVELLMDIVELLEMKLLNNDVPTNTKSK